MGRSPSTRPRRRLQGLPCTSQAERAIPQYYLCRIVERALAKPATLAVLPSSQRCRRQRNGGILGQRVRLGAGVGLSRGPCFGNGTDANEPLFMPRRWRDPSARQRWRLAEDWRELCCWGAMLVPAPGIANNDCRARASVTANRSPTCKRQGNSGNGGNAAARVLHAAGYDPVGIRCLLCDAGWNARLRIVPDSRGRVWR